MMPTFNDELRFLECLCDSLTNIEELLINNEDNMNEICIEFGALRTKAFHQLFAAREKLEKKSK